MNLTEQVSSRVSLEDKQRIREAPESVRELILIGLDKRKKTTKEEQEELYNTKIAICNKEIEERQKEKEFYESEKKKLEEEMEIINKEEDKEKIRKKRTFLSITDMLNKRKMKRENGPYRRLSRKEFIHECKMGNIDPDYVYGKLSKELKNEVEYF